MESFTDRVLEFQRRATQTVLEKVGAVDKTVDDQFEHNLSNFKRLGEFMTHLEQSTSASLTNMEKMCQSNTTLATSLCNFILSELSEDKEFSTGLLAKYFKKANSTGSNEGENDNINRSKTTKFQDSIQRLYESFSTIGHENMRTASETVTMNVVHPIKRDQDMNKITKQLIDKKRKLNLDYDSIKRSSDMEKVRNVKEEFDTISKKANVHIQSRSFIRCKLIVHSIITLVQQFCIFFESNSVLLEGLLEFVEPLIDSYQLSSNDLQDIYAAKKPTQPNDNVPPPSSNKQQQQPPQYPSPPPSYKESVKQQQQQQQQQQTPNQQFRNININDIPNGNNRPSSPYSDYSSSTDGTTTPSDYSSPQRKEQLFNVWDEDEKPSSEANGHQQQNKSKPSEFEDWMMNSNEPSNKPRDPPLSSDPLWDEPLTPQQNKYQHSEQFVYVSPQDPHINRNINMNNNGSQSNINNSGNMNMNNNSGRTNINMNNNINNSGNMNMNNNGSQPNFNNSGSFNMNSQFKNMNNNNGSQSNFNNSGNMNMNNNGMGNNRPPMNDTFPTHFSNNSYNDLSGGMFTPPTPTVSQHVDASQHLRGNIEPQVSEKIKQWAEKNGKKNNIRVLLTTLHEVLWEESGWEKITLGAVIAPPQVKKVYRKAIMVVHPDKVNKGSVEQKMIAQRIFESLREGFDAFKGDLNE